MRGHSSSELQDFPLRSGAIVEVLSEEEIRATLDERDCLDGLPFMREMRAFCGGVFRVHKRAEKTCCEGKGLRRMRNAVFLEGARCDGGFHDGCGRKCMFFWKEAWLRRTSLPLTPPVPERKACIVPVEPDKPYSCQSTLLAQATEPLPLWELSQYARDLRGGQLSPLEFVRVVRVLAWNKARRILGIPDVAGPASNRGCTPCVVLNLEPGEWVEFKPRAEIEATLDPGGKNKGLLFCHEMLRFCGTRAPVLSRVERMILETDGRKRAASNTVLLEGVVCDGRSHRGCMRACHYLCKEAWLRRVTPVR
jgi:hypothetical protein